MKRWIIIAGLALAGPAVADAPLHLLPALGAPLELAELSTISGGSATAQPAPAAPLPGRIILWDELRRGGMTGGAAPILIGPGASNSVTSR